MDSDWKRRGKDELLEKASQNPVVWALFYISSFLLFLGLAVSLSA